jgi:CBS-domain-containing membrane protein
MTEDATLYQVIEKLTVQGLHRVPVMDIDCNNIIDIVSQSTILEYLCQNIG